MFRYRLDKEGKPIPIFDDVVNNTTLHRSSFIDGVVVMIDAETKISEDEAGTAVDIVVTDTVVFVAANFAELLQYMDHLVRGVADENHRQGYFVTTRLIKLEVIGDRANLSPKLASMIGTSVLANEGDIKQDDHKK